MKRRFGFCDLLLVLCCCFVFSGAKCQVLGVDDREAIVKVIDDYSLARADQDTVLLKQILTEDIDQLVSSGEWRRGIRTSVEGMQRSSNTNQGERTIDVDHIRLITATAAIVDARYTIRNLEGEVTRNMWSTFIVVKKGGEWKITGIRNMLPAG